MPKVKGKEIKTEIKCGKAGNPEAKSLNSRSLSLEFQSAVSSFPVYFLVLFYNRTHASQSLANNFFIVALYKTTPEGPEQISPNLISARQWLHISW